MVKHLGELLFALHVADWPRDSGLLIDHEVPGRIVVGTSRRSCDDDKNKPFRSLETLMRRTNDKAPSRIAQASNINKDATETSRHETEGKAEAASSRRLKLLTLTHRR